MKRSISKRIFRIFLVLNLISLLIIASASWFALGSLKNTMLEIDKRAEIEHFVTMQTPEKLISIQSATLTILYIPDGDKKKHSLPIMFEGLDVPYRGEVEMLGRSYSVAVQKIKHGTYYMAKDMSLFQQRKQEIVIAMLGLLVAIFILSIILAELASRMISRPMQQLADDIHESSLSNQSPSSSRSSSSNTSAAPINISTRLNRNYRDKELDEISSAINLYFDEIEGFVSREQTMMAMASHELRTPISVILGAAEVIANRDQLEPNDKKTLKRILSSATDMADNVKSLLGLARKIREAIDYESFSLDALLEELYQEYSLVNEAYQRRLKFETSQQSILINSDPVLVKMLVSNVIQNAMNHTKGLVTILVFSDHIAIEDQGHWDERNESAKPTDDFQQESSTYQESSTCKESSSGLGTYKESSTAFGLYRKLSAGFGSYKESSTGFGLYIVSMICKHLGWQVEILNDDPSGTCVNIWFQADESSKKS